MGGRGASSGISDKGVPYGREYTSVLKSSNIKFVKKNDESASAPLETMTKGRVYVTLGSDGEPRYISYHDNENKRNKTVDLKKRTMEFCPTLIMDMSIMKMTRQRDTPT